MHTWRVNVVPYLGGEADFYDADAGKSVLDILGDDVAPNVTVYFGAELLPKEKWAETFPAPGGVVNCIVQNANLGSGGKQILRLAAFVALVYFTAGAGATWAGSLGLTGWGATAAYAGAFVLGSMAINSLLPPPTAELGGGLGGSAAFSRLNSITGTSNNINPYGAVPTVIGVVEDYFPPHAAQPYLENSGDDQYLRMLLDIGNGEDLGVSNLRIGDSDIDQYDDVQWELTRTPTLYTNDVSQESLAITMQDLTSYVRTTQPDVTEIGVDLSFLKGLFAVNSDGDFVNAWNYVTINFRKVGTTQWYGVAPPTPGISLSSGAIRRDNLSTYKITSNKNGQLRVGVRWQVDKGQYEVQVTAGSPGYPDSVQHQAEMTWSLLTSISPYKASDTGTLKLAVRIRASDQLNGIIQNLSCRVAQKVPTWSSANGWSAPVETRNPAWFSAWLLKGGGGTVKDPRTDSQLDLPGYAEWAAQCDKMKMEVGYSIDADSSLKDCLDDLFKAGRSKFGMMYSKISPLLDKRQQQPVQMFTPANCSDFQTSRSFRELPQALRVSFTNQAASSQKDVRVVYAPGYGPTTATRFETMDIPQATNPEGIWHIAKYHLRVMRARPNNYSLSADIEHFPCQVGKLVKLAFPTIGKGLQYGRVVSVEDGRIVLDKPFFPETGKGYSLRVRRTQDGSIGSGHVPPLITWDTTYITFDMVPPYPTAVYAKSDSFDVQPGDLYVLGEAGELSIDAIVKSVKPSTGMNATIELVDAAPEVLADDDRDAPAFVSTINHKRWNAPPDPPDLRIGHFRGKSDNTNSHGRKGNIGNNRRGGVVRLPSYKDRYGGILPGTNPVWLGGGLPK